MQTAGFIFLFVQEGWGTRGLICVPVTDMRDGGELAGKKVKTAKLEMSLGPRGRSWRAGDALHGQKNVMRREKLGGRQSVLQLLCTPQHQQLGC